MKKYVFILAVAMLVGVFQANAQLGVKIGYNFAKMTGDVGAGQTEKSLNNFHIGAFLDKDLIPILDLRVGLMYSPKGTKTENVSGHMQTTINYLELPVLAKVKLGPVYALGGIYGAYALKGKSEIDILGTVVTGDVDFDQAELKRFDYGMKFGLGVQAGLGPLHIFAQGEYSFGLMDVNNGTGDAIKNKVISASIGVLVGF